MKHVAHAEGLAFTPNFAATGSCFGRCERAKTAAHPINAVHLFAHFATSFLRWVNFHCQPALFLFQLEFSIGSNSLENLFHPGLGPKRLFQ